MAKLTWDQRKQHLYETGVDHGVFYPYDSENDSYTPGVAWNGIINVSLNPEGGEPTVFYADNIKYLSLTSVEELGFTIRAYYFPEEFRECDGSQELATGVFVGQQERKTFGFGYRTYLGDEVDYTKRGYMLRLLYGATASPSGGDSETQNDSPSAREFEWECDTTPVPVSGKLPTAIVEIDSTKVNATKLAELETILYGDATSTPRLPLPDEIATLFSNT